MDCELYCKGNCIGLKMYSKAISDIRETCMISNIEDSEEKIKKHCHVRNYCMTSGIYDDKKCEFLEWFENYNKTVVDDLIGEDDDSEDLAGVKSNCHPMFDNISSRDKAAIDYLRRYPNGRSIKD